MKFFKLLADFFYTPIRVWREEKQLDREAQMLMVGELCGTLKSQNASMIKMIGFVEKFLDTFQVDGPPERRVVTDADEIATMLETYHLKEDDLL